MPLSFSDETFGEQNYASDIDGNATSGHCVSMRQCVSL